MEKKRSKGVTFWGWIFIVFSIVGLLTAINPKQQIQLYGIRIVIYGVVFSVANLICGIFVLKLSEIARKVVIVLGIISIFSIPLYFKPVFNAVNSEDFYIKAKQQITEQTKPEYQQEALEKLEKSREVGKKVLPIVLIVIFGTPILILELLPIYFFTRPKVIEQFRQP